MSNKVVHASTEGINAIPLVMNMVRRMRQSAPAVVGAVKRQIIRAKEVITPASITL